MSAPGAVVIGSGVDELVCAHYLARAGHRVLVLEQHVQPDGLQAGWIAPRIIRELDLERRGLRVHRAEPWVAVPLAQGGRLELWPDMARSVEAIGRVSAADAAKWPAFCERIGRIASLLESLYTAPPPAPLRREPREWARLAAFAWRARRQGRRTIEDLLRLAPMPVADLLDDWFESDALKAALGAAGVAHLCRGPRSGGTAFAFAHHHVGCPAGVFRPLRSNLAQVLSALPGVEIRRGARVAGITARAGRVSGVALAHGEEIPAALVVSGADPRLTLTKWIDGAWLDPELSRAARYIRARGVVARMVLTLARPPDFATLCMASSLDAIERAHDDAKYGRVSREPCLEARYGGPDAHGRHVVEIDIQYAPYALADGAWDGARGEALGELALQRLVQHAPGVAGAVIDRRVLSPRDFETVHGHPQGQAHHAELALDQAFWMRPAAGIAHYRTPLAGLYLCGPGTHPGAGMAGASGMNAAHTIRDDAR